MEVTVETGGGLTDLREDDDYRSRTPVLSIGSRWGQGVGVQIVGVVLFNKRDWDSLLRTLFEVKRILTSTPFPVLCY